MTKKNKNKNKGETHMMTWLKIPEDIKIVTWLLRQKTRGLLLLNNPHLNLILFSPEDDTLQVKWIFNDARGGDSNSQHILLGGKVGRLGNPIQRVQVTSEEAEMEPG